MDAPPDNPDPVAPSAGPAARRTGRSLVPLVLLGILAVGVVTAAIAGQIESQAGPVGPSAVTTSTPGRWVSQLLATTARAKRAQFTYAEATSTSTPLFSNTVTGAGAVDFAAGRVRVHQVEQQLVSVPSNAGVLPHGHAGQQVPVNVVAPVGAATHEVHNTIAMIGVGRSAYQQLGGLNGEWLSMGSLRDPHAQLGLEFAGDAAVALGGLEGIEPVAAVQRRGRAFVDGTPTTRFVVANASPRCEGKTANTRIPAVTGVTTVWVDDQGRLLRARYTFSYTTPHSDAGKGLPSGTTRTTATLTFSRFGSAVSIFRPSPLLTPSGSSVSIALRAKCVGNL